MADRTKPFRELDFEPDTFFLLRTPLLPLEELAAWSAGLRAAALSDPAPPELERALADDRARLTARLCAIVTRPEVREALFVASPSLAESVTAWLEQPESARGRAAEAPLVRYFERMCARTTPFGLFAGCSVGRIADRTELELAPRAAYARHTRLDNDFLEAVVDALIADPAVRERLAFAANDSVYRVGGRYRYVETRRAARTRTYVLSAVDAIEAVETALAAAGAGARLSAIAAAIAATDAEISEDDARAFVEELCEAGLLVPALAPALTGPEPIHALLEDLRGVAEEPRRALASVQAELGALDRAGLGAAPQTYRDAAKSLEGVADSGDLGRLFQIDLIKPSRRLELGRDVVGELARGASLLARVGYFEESEVLVAFSRAFSERFGDEEVPLSEALDPEYGVGLGERSAEDASSLLGAVELLPAAGAPGVWSARERALLRLVSGALARRRTQIELDEASCQALEGRSPRRLPGAFSVSAWLHAASAEALASGAFQVQLEGVIGPSGARLFGRFCHGDPELTERVREHLCAEERRSPDAIFAEVVHWPDGRLGNVLLRPVLRDYEIPILARSGVDAAHRISIAELRVSVRGGRIVLRSARLDREIQPRLTSAHAFASPTNLHAYRFLCALAGQSGATGLGWSWGPLGGAAFLPRVSHGRLVLAPARWLVAASELAAWSKLRPGTSDAFSAVQRLRRERELPRHVAIAEGDHILPVDLDNVLSVEAFVQAARSKTHLEVIEQLGVDAGAAVGPEGRFRAEIVVPFLRRAEPAEAERAAARPVRARPAPKPRAAVRRFAPGSEWLYLQLYAGTSTLDRLLLALGPLVQRLLEQGAIDRWFFVRYSDPAWHLRLRLHGEPRVLWSAVMTELSAAVQAFEHERLVYRVAYDTYEREIERYGGPAGIELAERLFHVDSAATLLALETLTGDDGADLRWRSALGSVDALLAALGLDLAARRALTERLRGDFKGEIDGGAALESWISQLYRSERETLDALFARELPEDSPFEAPRSAFRRFVPRFEAIGVELRELAREGQLGASLDELCASFVHMHLNRLLRGDHRRQEAVLYDLLTRFYTGRLKRAANAANAANATQLSGGAHEARSS